MRKLIAYLRNLREFLRKGGLVKTEIVKVPVGQSMRGRRIVITGASSGIGLALAKRCIEEGATVMITGRNGEKLDCAQKELSSDNVRTMVWDVGNADDAERMIAEAESMLGGPVDAFVNNAGIANRQSAMTLTRSTWDGVVNINLTGAVFAAKAICQRWVQTGRKGVLLNVCSFAAFEGVVDAYGVSKVSLVKLTEGWAKVYARKGIRINAIAPGVIVGTNINTLQRSISTDGNLFCPAYPSERFGVPAEIAEVALFLLNDSSSYVYGQTILCDGGATLA